LSPAALTEAVGELHAALDAACEERAGIAIEEGHSVACRRGCDACCGNVIMAWEPEAMVVASWLQKPENRPARESFAASYPAWHAAVGDAPERMRALHAGGNGDAAQRIYEDLRRRAIPCAFLRDGACTVYPVRPLVCRNTHALDTAEHCRPGAARRPLFLDYAAVDELLDEGGSWLREVHAKVTRTPGAGALCESVHRLLAGPAAAAGAPGPASPAGKPGRNDPCPCGSGRKYKRCCGA
jgi:Fe-S-cluster containining protein